MKNPEKSEPERREQRELTKLKYLDFKAGHWFGLKEPPLGLNEVFLMEHPDIAAEARKMFNTLKPGEEVLFSSMEVEVEEGKKETVDVKVYKREDLPNIMYIHAYPRSQEYYHLEDKLDDEPES